MGKYKFAKLGQLRRGVSTTIERFHHVFNSPKALLSKFGKGGSGKNTMPLRHVRLVSHEVL